MQKISCQLGLYILFWRNEKGAGKSSRPRSLLARVRGQCDQHLINIPYPAVPYKGERANTI
ncbi:MAG: hypothetical protein PVG01_03120 [Desulfobacterales bacterium]|jgi:hypothetical protein